MSINIFLHSLKSWEKEEVKEEQSGRKEKKEQNSPDIYLDWFCAGVAN